MSHQQAAISIYSTCPHSRQVELSAYLARVEEVSRWSESAGCAGMLVYTDNSILDPWAVAQHVMGVTTALRPLVAVQPIYMHPFAVAKKITSLGSLYGRAVDLNLLAGGFRNDLTALGDTTPHDERYARTVEYATIVRRLLSDADPVTLEGTYYRVEGLRLSPPLDPELRPRLLISGSSDAGREAAREIGAVAVRYPQRIEEEDETLLRLDEVEHGIRVGIVARETPEEAWRVARERFPSTREGELLHALAMKVSDSAWHAQLSESAEGGETTGDPYWLWPFKSYGTFCPYLVGTYDVVGAELGRYLDQGVRTLITDIPAEEDDLLHARRAVEVALARAGSTR